VALRHRAPHLVLALSYALAAWFLAWPFLTISEARGAAAPQPPLWRPPAGETGPTAPPRPTLAPAPTAAPSPTPSTPPQPVRVLRTYPIDGDGDVGADDAITLVFDQPMDPNPAACHFAISPTIALEMAWPAADRLELRAPGWQAEVPYEFTLLQARGQSGGSLVEPVSLRFARVGYVPIPILMYHHVDPMDKAPPPDIGEWMVSPQQFAAELNLLISLGAHQVTMEAVADYLERNEPLPPRPVVITFDDANRCVLEYAVPELRARGWQAMLFVPAAYPGSVGAIGWDELRALAAEGYEIGAHSYDHVKVHRLTPEQAARQMGEARAVLERETGAAVRFFAYPYGYFSDAAIAQLQHHGYRGAVTIDPTVYQTHGGLFTLARIRTTYGAPLQTLREKLPWADPG
jgi:peptidoglycan/xylan/chitin deacetylase (PgdA/CDA1 family)